MSSPQQQLVRNHFSSQQCSLVLRAFLHLSIVEGNKIRVNRAERDVLQFGESCQREKYCSFWFLSSCSRNLLPVYPLSQIKHLTGEKQLTDNDMRVLWSAPATLLATSFFLLSHGGREPQLPSNQWRCCYIQTGPLEFGEACLGLAFELNSFSAWISTYTPWHEVGEAPVVLFVEEKMADPTTEGFLIVFVIDDLQHCLCMTRPWPEEKTQSLVMNSTHWEEL